MLVAALVWFAFDVEIDPSADRIAIRWAVRCDGGRRGPGIGGGEADVGRGLIDADARKPGFAVECSAVGDGEHEVVLGARGGEAEMHAGPIARAGDRFRLHIERHGSHGERGAGGDGRAVEIADGELVGADPAGEFVGLADGEGDGSGLDASVASGVAGFEAHRHLAIAGDGGIGGGDAAQGGPGGAGAVEGGVE